MEFNVMIGDDTGLMKKVKMIYNYQTEVFGQFKGGSKHTKFMQDEEVPEKNDLNEEEINEMTEKVRKETQLDADGQPLYKEITRAVLAK
jgi:hypothetical protein